MLNIKLNNCYLAEIVFLLDFRYYKTGLVFKYFVHFFPKDFAIDFPSFRQGFTLNLFFVYKLDMIKGSKVKTLIECTERSACLQ